MSEVDLNLLGYQKDLKLADVSTNKPTQFDISCVAIQAYRFAKIPNAEFYLQTATDMQSTSSVINAQCDYMSIWQNEFLNVNEAINRNKEQNGGK